MRAHCSRRSPDAGRRDFKPISRLLFTSAPSWWHLHAERAATVAAFFDGRVCLQRSLPTGFGRIGVLFNGFRLSPESQLVRFLVSARERDVKSGNSRH
jgi:hypothetical protein